MNLLKKGGQYLWDNSDTIFKTVKENAGPLFDKAKEMLFGKAKEEADKGEKAIVAKAKDIVATTPGLTLVEQQALLKEAQILANKNRAALIEEANKAISQKREDLKRSIYEKYGKGKPTK